MTDTTAPRSPRAAAPAKKTPGARKTVARTPAKTPRKAASPVAAAPAPAAAPAEAVVAKVKNKLVRDSFTIPKVEYAVLEGLKARATDLKRPAKKSEILRAGIAALAAMDDKVLLKALNAVASLKTGRPTSR